MSPHSAYDPGNSSDNQDQHSTLSSNQSGSQPTSPIHHTPPSSGTTVTTPTSTNDSKEKHRQEKKERHATKKLLKELSACKTMLEEMEVGVSCVNH